jgi:hypothetical protein
MPPGIFEWTFPLLVLMESCGESIKGFRKLRFWSQQDRRQHSRHACRITVHYLMQGSWYGGSIRNISDGGVYVRCIERGRFSKGEPILMVVDLRVLRDQVMGKHFHG